MVADRYAALEAGAAPALVTAWIAETQAFRRTLEEQLRTHRDLGSVRGVT